LGILLIWLADRLDLPSIIWARVKDWWTRSVQRVTDWYGGIKWKDLIMAVRRSKKAETLTSA